MASLRSSAIEIARLLDRSGQPIYVLDDERRIVFFNSAACQWIGRTVEEMLGVECQYHSSSDFSAPGATACALCPPPEVLAGQFRSAHVCCPAADGRQLFRQVQFVPLLTAQHDLVGVLAVVGLEELDPNAIEQMPNSELLDHDLHTHIQRLRLQERSRYQVDRLLGIAPAIQRVRQQIALAGSSTASVLIVGPPGSGRQWAARTIHYTSQGNAALVPLACSVLSPELLRSTINALLRADVNIAGQRPTLLLNEVDQLSAEMQAELTGLLAAAASKVRLIATARQPLSDLLNSKACQPALACALSTLVIELPPLAQRLEDLPLLSQLFLEQENARGGKQLGGITSEALDLLAGYAWPGNLDELQDALRQAHAHAIAHQITVADLPRRLHLAAAAAAHPAPVEETIVLEEFLGNIELELIQRALVQAKGNKSHAAKLLGMTRPRLYRRLEQLGLGDTESDPQE